MNELTECPPGACQLDKGAAPPYNPLLLACGQHLRLFGTTIPNPQGQSRSCRPQTLYQNDGNLNARMGGQNGSQPSNWSQMGN